MFCCNLCSSTLSCLHAWRIWSRRKLQLNSLTGCSSLDLYIKHLLIINLFTGLLYSSLILQPTLPGYLAFTMICFQRPNSSEDHLFFWMFFLLVLPGWAIHDIKRRAKRQKGVVSGKYERNFSIISLYNRYITGGFIFMMIFCFFWNSYVLYFF